MKNLNFQPSFSKKKSTQSISDIEINLLKQDKYSKSDLIDYIKQYEKLASFQVGSLDDLQTMNEELQRQVSTTTEELRFQSENTDILRDDARNAMISYQKLCDQGEANTYLENFAAKLAKKCLNMEDGSELENDHQNAIDSFKEITNRFGDLKKSVDDTCEIIAKQDNTAEKLDTVTQYLEEIFKIQTELNETINDDLSIVNENILQVISRFDMLCDEMNSIYTNVQTQELNKIKGFLFLTETKYHEINSIPASLKLQVKELNTKLSKTEALYNASQDEIKSSTEIITMYQKQISELQQQSEHSFKQNNDNTELQDIIQDLTNQNETFKNEINEKSMLIESHTVTQDGLLAKIKNLEQNSSQKSVSQESQLKQEILRREQIEKDYHKQDSKYNEVNMYLRQEVERGTTLVQQNEKISSKYKKVKDGLLELSEKYKELEESSNKIELDKVAINELDELKKNLENQKKENFDQQEKLSDFTQEQLEERSKIDQHNIVLQKKDNDFQELKKILEEKQDFIESLQNSNIREIEKVKAQKDKRKNGLKEIKKLKTKIEDLEDQITNQSSWFGGTKNSSQRNTELDFSINDMSVMIEPNQVGVLETLVTDIQAVYKKVVLLLPLEDNEANMKVIEIERKMNNVINSIWEHIADA